MVSQREQQVLQLCSNCFQPLPPLPEGGVGFLPDLSLQPPPPPLTPLPNPLSLGCTRKYLSMVSWCAVQRCFFLLFGYGYLISCKRKAREKGNEAGLHDSDITPILSFLNLKIIFSFFSCYTLLVSIYKTTLNFKRSLSFTPLWKFPQHFTSHLLRTYRHYTSDVKINKQGSPVSSNSVLWGKHRKISKI